MQRKLFLNFPLLGHFGCPLQHAGSWQEGMLLEGNCMDRISNDVLWCFMGTLATRLRVPLRIASRNILLGSGPWMWVGTSPIHASSPIAVVVVLPRALHPVLFANRRHVTVLTRVLPGADESTTGSFKHPRFVMRESWDAIHMNRHNWFVWWSTASRCVVLVLVLGQLILNP